MTPSIRQICDGESSAGRFLPSTVTHQPDAYVLPSRRILGIRQVSHADRHITAVATFILTLLEMLTIAALLRAARSAHGFLELGLASQEAEGF
jgi:hypothetical protein